jgi:hypothetical protein
MTTLALPSLQSNVIVTRPPGLVYLALFASRSVSLYRSSYQLRRRSALQRFECGNKVDKFVVDAPCRISYRRATRALNSYTASGF